MAGFGGAKGDARMSALSVSSAIGECNVLLQSITDRLDRISDSEALPFSERESRDLVDAIAGVYGVLLGADAVLAVEVRRWGL